jgi:uncharacterized protein (TIGR02996 family)
MPSSEESAFRASITANPHDDAPRLAFADFLDERSADGDSQTAAFIRAGVELALTDEGDPKYPALLARVRRAGVLTREGRQPWLDSIPGARVSFHRGLITGAVIAPYDHLRYPAEHWQGVPVEQLQWVVQTGNEGQWAAQGSALAARPELERIHTLGLFAPSIFVDPILTTSPHLANLRALRVEFRYGNERDDDHRCDIASRMKLPALDSLRVHGAWHHGPGPREWEAFVGAAPKSLSRVHLDTYSENPEWFEEWDITWFQATPHQKLRSAACWLRARGHHNEVANLGDPRTAERAFLMGAGSGGSLDLSPYPAARRLHVEMHSESQGTGELSHLPEAAQLEWLSTNDLFNREDRRFVTGEQLTHLRRLSVQGNSPALAHGAYARRLHRLDWGTGYASADLKKLLAAEMPELRWLTLRGCKGPGTFDPLPRVTGMPNLCTLWLVDYPREQGALEAPLARLACAPGLPHLSLVGVGSFSERRWWVLGDGRATPVHPSVEPIWRDEWEFDPTDDWI